MILCLQGVVPAGGNIKNTQHSQPFPLTLDKISLIIFHALSPDSDSSFKASIGNYITESLTSLEPAQIAPGTACKMKSVYLKTA